MSGPSGHQNSSALAMKRRYRCGKSGTPSGHGSKLETWLAARTKPPSFGTFSTPSACSRKTHLIAGNETMPAKK